MKRPLAGFLLPLSLVLTATSGPLTVSAAELAVTGAKCTIVGTSKADVLAGTFASDVICGLGGNDVIYGSAGNDVIDAGSGNDRIFAGAGHDQVFGGKGSDFVDGGTGANLCVRDSGDKAFRNCKTVKALPKYQAPAPKPQTATASPTVSPSVSPTVSPSISASVSPTVSPSTSPTPVTSSPATGPTTPPSSGGSSGSGGSTTPTPVSENVVVGSYAGGSSAISNQPSTPSTTVTTQASTPITLDFESGADLIGFGGDSAGVDAHPAGGTSGSTKAVKVVRGGESFAGTVFYNAPSGVSLISANGKTVTLNFYSPVANQPVLVKLEDASNSSRYVETLATAGSVGWQTLSFNFDSPRSGSPAFSSDIQYRKAVIFYAFGSTTAGATYYFDQVSFPAVTTTQTTVPGSSAPTYTQGSLLWEENFDGAGSLDASRWTARFCGHSAANGGGACHNNEQQHYLQDAIQLDGQGNAVITAKRVTTRPSLGSCLSWSGNCDFTSGRFDTQGKVSFMYGVIEARIQNPRGGANWPAFWMLGTDITSVGWPASGEIDIMEGKSGSRVASAIHWSNGGNDAYEYGEASGGNYSSAYHVYKLHWLENYIAIYVDDVKVLEERNTTLNQAGSWAFNHPFFLILNNAISPAGGFSDTYDGWSSSQMKIDYVRYYQLNGQGQLGTN
jgi:beta-glucanase (GH16 family)